MCWRPTWCLPGPAAPLRADCADDGYEELPVSLPPHVPRGLSRDDAPSAGGEDTTFAVEQVVAPASNGGFGIGAGAWLALVCASSVYAKVAGPSQS